MDNTVEAARAIKAACLKLVQDNFEQARMDGLCCDGAMEVTLSAIHNFRFEQLVQELVTANTQGTS